MIKICNNARVIIADAHLGLVVGSTRINNVLTFTKGTNYAVLSRIPPVNMR